MNATNISFTRLRARLARSPLDAPPVGELSTFYHSTSGMYFAARPEFLPGIKALVQEVRDLISAARAAGRFICYLSVPISSLGGGYFPVNNEIAKATKSKLESRFGRNLLAVNPAEYDLPKVNDVRALGSEYMAVWGDVLAGSDGSGPDFDMVYFAGPVDVAHYFKIAGDDTLGQLERWITDQASTDPAFQQFIATGTNRADFIRYYGLRASSAYSKGAHDEWNIVVSINSKRGIGAEIAVYFNGEPIEPGDYDDRSAIGNQILAT